MNYRIETCSPVPCIKFGSDVDHFVYRLPKGSLGLVYSNYSALQNINSSRSSVEVVVG